MSGEIPRNNPEKKEVLDDNARKFTLETIDPTLFADGAVSSFVLTTDWLETDEASEKKIAHKRFDNGDIQILLITKVTKDGNRTSEKAKITDEEYKQLLESSVLHLEKKRYEFAYSQNDALFSIKYDEFADSKLRILEVDAASEEMRDFFSPNDFPAKLTEVTGNMKYYGYRVAAAI